MLSRGIDTGRPADENDFNGRYSFHAEVHPMSVSSVAERWVEEVAGLTQPGTRRVVRRVEGRSTTRLIERCSRDGTLLPLNPRTYPNCYLHRSHPIDVARTEQLTFICTARARRTPAPPTTGWRRPRPRRRPARCSRGACAGRTMYVIPYLMGPAGSPMSRVGVMVTDSAYVVASMHIMTRVGAGRALEHMRGDDDFIAGPALARRPLARPPVHPALPRGAADLERGLGLRRQRAARQEVPRPAHRLLAGARRRAGSPSTC